MLKKMIVVAAVLGMASVASAAMLSLSSVTLAPGETGTITVSIAGGANTIFQTDLILFIGDGGATVGGALTAPPAPEFVGGNLGAAWAGKGAVNQYYNADLGAGPEKLIAGNIGLTASGTIVDGELFTFQVKANEAGVFPVTFYADGTYLNGGTAPIELASAPGMITVTPEPAALALLGLGGLFIRRRRA